jgi:hypothetical protein
VKWAKLAVILGSLLILIGFCLGVDTPISTTVDGAHYACPSVISPSILVAGAPGTALPAPAATRCAPLESAASWLLGGVIVLGGLVLIAGWTVLRERDLDRIRPLRPVPAPVPR